MTDEGWFTLYQANYFTSSRIWGLHGFCIVAATIVPWLFIAAIICAALQWW